jgi:ribonuclease HI
LHGEETANKIKFMPSPPLFGTPIALYADGSYSAEFGLGAWAFLVPALKLEGVGSSAGETITRFELLAVVHGLEAIVDADLCGSSAIHVYSDCESTVSLIEHLVAALPLKRPERYQDRVDLLPRLEAVLAHRQLRVTKYGSGKVEHGTCHRNALRRLREEVNADPRIRHRVILARHESRLARLAEERGTLLTRLEEIEEENTMLSLEIAGIRLAAGAAGLEEVAVEAGSAAAGRPKTGKTGVSGGIQGEQSAHAR